MGGKLSPPIKKHAGAKGLNSTKGLLEHLHIHTQPEQEEISCKSKR